MRRRTFLGLFGAVLGGMMLPKVTPPQPFRQGGPIASGQRIWLGPEYVLTADDFNKQVAEARYDEAIHRLTDPVYGAIEREKRRHQ